MVTCLDGMIPDSRLFEVSSGEVCEAYVLHVTTIHVTTSHVTTYI